MVAVRHPNAVAAIPVCSLDCARIHSDRENPPCDVKKGGFPWFSPAPTVRKAEYRPAVHIYGIAHIHVRINSYRYHMLLGWCRKPVHRKKPVPCNFDGLLYTAKNPGCHLMRSVLISFYLTRFLTSVPSEFIYAKPVLTNPTQSHSKLMSIQPLGLRVSPHLQGLGVELDNVAFNYVSDTPPWELERPNIILELAASRKSDTPPITYSDQYLTIRNRFPRHIPFYTDGSKDTERVSVAAVLINHSYDHRIQNHSSIFTAEARAILLALECIEHSNRKRFLIFTNSMSCLQALDHLKIDHPIIEHVICKLMSLKASGFDIHLCWLPGHVGILGNERADRAAKAARRTNMQPCLIPPSDFKPIIRKHITAMWQATWDESPLNKLHEIAPIVNEPRTHHLSHSRLTHEFLLKGEPPPECIPCNCPLTIKHLLIECVDFNDVHQRFYQVPSLQDLFKIVKPEVILEFLKAAALYRLL